MDKTYNPQNFEKRIYQNWLQKKYFAAKVNKNKKENLTILGILYIVGITAGIVLDLLM